MIQKIIRLYFPFLFLFLFWILIAKIAAPLGMLATLVFMGYFILIGKEENAFLFFLLILLLSDSKSGFLYFIKDLRIPAALTLFGYGLIKYNFIYRFRKQNSYLLVIPFLLLGLFSALESPSIFIAIQKTVSYFIIVFLGVFYFPYLVIKTNTKIIYDIIFYITLSLFFAILMRYINPDFVISRGAFRGLMGNPNGMGLLCTLLIPFTLLIPLFRKKTDYSFIVILVIQLASLYLSGSRTALGAVFIFLAICVFFYRSPIISSPIKRLESFARFSIIIGAFFGGIYFLSSDSLSGGLASLGLGETLEIETLSTGSGRFAVWPFAFEEINKFPFLGRGFEYDNIYFNTNQLFFNNLGHEGGTHNSFISLAMNTGYIGLSLFLFFNLYLFSQIRGEAGGFLLAFIPLLLISANFEAWLSASLNYVTILYYGIIGTLLLKTTYPFKD